MRVPRSNVAARSSQHAGRIQVLSFMPNRFVVGVINGQRFMNNCSLIYSRSGRTAVGHASLSRFSICIATTAQKS